MNIRCFLLASAVRQNENHTLTLEGVFGKAIGTAFPETLDLAHAVVVIDADPGDPAEITDVMFRLRYPDGHVREKPVPIVFAHTSSDIPEGLPQRYHLIETLQDLKLEGPGTYWFELVRNQEVIAATPLGVAERSKSTVPAGTIDEKSPANDELVAGALAVLRNPSNLARLGLQEIYLGVREDALVLKIIHQDGSVVQTSLSIPDWKNRFANDPAGLANAINSVLPGKNDPVIPPVSSDKRYLFLRVMDDLRVRCGSPDDYQILGIAGLLRLLLWDAHPLATQINRDLHERSNLTFAVGETIKPRVPEKTSERGKLRLVKSGLILRAAEGRFYPANESEVQQVVNLKEFFRLPVMIVEEHVFTALDLMQHMAMVGGLLHAGPPKSGPRYKKDVAYLAHRAMLPLSGEAPGLSTLRAIGRVAYTALVPLQLRLLKQAQEPHDIAQHEPQEDAG